MNTQEPQPSSADEKPPSSGLFTPRGCIISVFLFTLLLVGISYCVPQYGLVQTGANQMKAASNARVIIGTLRHYAVDHNGHYPDSDHPEITSSNEAFRYVFTGGYTLDERIFGCPASRFVPDGNVGTSPDFKQALQPGENHWAMTAGLTVNSPAKAPVIFENPANNAWPPRWDISISGQPLPGRAWPRARIILGQNDGSVEIHKLITPWFPKDPLQPLAPDATGQTPFDLVPKDPAKNLPRILNIQRTDRFSNPDTN